METTQVYDVESEPSESVSQEPQEPEHQHIWQFHLNANHTALRGCQLCGATYGTLIAGEVDQLIWHRIQEAEEGES